MRKALAILAFLLFLSFAHSIGIKAPSSVPANVSWGFSVKLDPTEGWAKAAVKIDGAKVLDAYSNGTIVLDPYNGQFVLKAFLLDENTSSTSGLALYVSHIGLSEGDHIISAESESGSESRGILSYVALGQNFASETKDRLWEISRQLIDNENDKRSIRRAAKADANRISSLEEKSRQAGVKLEGVSEQAAKALALEPKVLALQQNALEQAAAAAKNSAGSPLAGLASLAGNSLVPLAYLAAAVLLIALFIFVARFAKEKLGQGSIYASRDEHGLPLSPEQRQSAAGEKFLGLGDGRWKFGKKKEKENGS